MLAMSSADAFPLPASRLGYQFDMTSFSGFHYQNEDDRGGGAFSRP